MDGLGMSALGLFHIRTTSRRANGRLLRPTPILGLGFPNVLVSETSLVLIGSFGSFDSLTPFKESFKGSSLARVCKGLKAPSSVREGARIQHLIIESRTMLDKTGMTLSYILNASWENQVQV